MAVARRQRHVAPLAPLWIGNSTSGLPLYKLNPVYTLGAIVMRTSAEYMRASLVILSESSYRHTLLRALILRTTTTGNGTSLHALAEEERTLFLDRPWVCCWRRSNLGGNTCWGAETVHGEEEEVDSRAARGRFDRVVTVYPNERNRSRDCLRTARERGRRRLVFGAYCHLVAELALLVARRISSGRCAAPPNVAATHLRLGDKTDLMMPVSPARGEQRAAVASRQAGRLVALGPLTCPTPADPRCASTSATPGTACASLWRSSSRR